MNNVEQMSLHELSITNHVEQMSLHMLSITNVERTSLVELSITN